MCKVLDSRLSIRAPRRALRVSLNARSPTISLGRAPRNEGWPTYVHATTAQCFSVSVTSAQQASTTALARLSVRRSFLYVVPRAGGRWIGSPPPATIWPLSASLLLRQVHLVQKRLVARVGLEVPKGWIDAFRVDLSVWSLFANRQDPDRDSECRDFAR
jgi:hypothetical protein